MEALLAGIVSYFESIDPDPSRAVYASLFTWGLTKSKEASEVSCFKK